MSTFLPPFQSDIFPKLSSLFGALLAQSSSWLLHQHALEAFAHFAEVQQGSSVHHAVLMLQLYFITHHTC